MKEVKIFSKHKQLYKNVAGIKSVKVILVKVRQTHDLNKYFIKE